MAYGGIYGFLIGLMEPIFPYTFDPLFGPLLTVGSPLTGASLTILVVTAVVGVLYTLITYYLMDLEKYHEVKEEISEIQERMKEAKENDDMGDSTDHMKKSLKKQMEMMKTRQKPMLVTFLLFFAVFPWLFATFSPVVPLSAQDGGYTGTFQFGDNSLDLQVEGDGEEAVVMVDGKEYRPGDNIRMEDMNWRLRNIQTGENPSVQFTSVIWSAPFHIPLTLSGGENGWLSAYILLNIPITMFLSRKLGIQ